MTKVTNVEFFANSTIIISWDQADEGYWGEVRIYNQDGKIAIDAETMGKDFVKELLSQVVDMAEMR